MKNIPLKAGFVVLLSLLLVTAAVSAQSSLNVLKKNGTTMSFDLGSLRKVTFPSGNILITPFSETPSTYSIADVRNLNFVPRTNIPEINVDGTALVNIYPNPFVNELALTSSGIILQISIFDLLGKKVVQFQPKTTSITMQMGHLTRGIYMLQVNTSEGKYATKIIKK